MADSHSPEPPERWTQAWYLWDNERIARERDITTYDGGAAETKANADPDTCAAFDALPTRLGLALDDVVTFINRFMVMSPEQGDALALWAAHTHAALKFDVVAYLFVSSPEKRSGKSLLLDLLELLVCRGRSTANISPAALYRMVDEIKPTLLFDEIDNIFTKGNKTDPAKADLVGLINAGFRKGRPAYRMGGPNMRVLEDFDPFGPKALAGIGNCLPDTTADRTVPIKLDRKPRSVSTERYRIRLHEDEGRALGERLGVAVSAVVDDLVFPDLPNELNDRQQDIWEPLLMIADAAGEDWPTRARAAAVALHLDADPAESMGTKLLEDIRKVFTDDPMLTKTLVERLNGIDESPWGGWRSDKGITSVLLVNMLKPYGIRSKQMRIGTARGRGFDRDAFTDVFARYLPDDVDDTVDNDLNPLFSPVNSNGHASVDASDDIAHQRQRALVNGVNSVISGGPGFSDAEDVDVDA